MPPPQPIGSPAIVIRVESGRATGAVAAVRHAPLDAMVHASVSGGEGLVSIVRLVSFSTIRRRMTEEEINELPARPPSIREKARKAVIEDRQEIVAVDPGDALSVSAGDEAEAQIQIVVPPDRDANVVTAAVLIEGSTWLPVSVPVTVLTGRVGKPPEISPPKIQRFLEPGETVVESVTLHDIVTPVKVIASVEFGDPLIRLQQLVTFRPVRKQYTPEEIEDLPPNPPSIREDARRKGYVDYQEVARSDGRTAITVGSGHLLKAYVTMSAPPRDFDGRGTARLIVEGTSWPRIEVPIEILVGAVEARFATNALTLRQGESAPLGYELRSRISLGTTVRFVIGQSGGTWRVAPETVVLPPRATLPGSLQVTAEAGAPTGTFPVGIDIRAFDGLQSRGFPLSLTVLPGRITVRPLRSNVTVTQGERTTLDVEVTNEGRSSLLSFSLVAPNGVTVFAPINRVGTGTVVLKLDLDVDRDAQVYENYPGVLQWASNVLEQVGSADLRVTVRRLPESRTLGEIVVTPPGTALGGRCELVVNNDGTYQFKGHMHDSGFPSYRFRVVGFVQSASGRLALMGQRSGEVEGTERSVLPPFPAPDRDYDWSEVGHSKELAEHWQDFRDGRLLLTKSYEFAGALSGAAALITELVDLLIAEAVLGPSLAGIIFVGSELGALLGTGIPHVNGVPGLILAASNPLVLGAGMLLAAAVEGLIDGRRMRIEEVDFAQTVFRDTVPYDRIVLSNLKNTSGGAFCWPIFDGSILIGLGDAVDNPVKKAPGTFIHELTHAWQLHNEAFTAPIIAKAAINEIRGSVVYQYGAPGPSWRTFNIEAQAAIVEHWFMGINPGNGHVPATVGAQDPNSPYFRYIVGNIMLGLP